MRARLRTIILISLAALAFALAVPAIGHAADITPPVTTDNADGLWRASDVTVTLTASDSESGPKTIYYSINGATPATSGGTVVDPQTMTLSFTVPAAGNDGIHTITYWSDDFAMNTEAGKTCQVKIDTTPPLTTNDNPGGWFNKTLVFHLLPSDAGSGVASTTVDGVPDAGLTVTVLADPAGHALDGLHTISYFSTDNVGNVEATKTTQVGIDTQLPVTGVSGSDAKWHRKPVTLTLSAQDHGLAGVKLTQYKIDKRAWTTGTHVTVKAPANHTSDGIHTVYYRSLDKAGNREVARSCKVRIDTLGPTCRATAAARAVTGTKVALRYRVNDTRSATANVTIVVKKSSGSTVKTIKLGSRRTGRAYSASFVCKLAAGSYRYYVYATDLAGNHQAKVGTNALTVMPRVFASLAASVSDSSPAQYSYVTAYAKAKDQLGHPLSGVKVVFVWHYKTTTPSEAHYSDSRGVASCERYISGATVGYHVVITMTATYKGVTKTSSTGFTPN